MIVITVLAFILVQGQVSSACFHSRKYRETTVYKYFKEDVIVHTDSGDVRGLESESLATKKTYYSFMGIPFAKPPVGDLRFEPPQAVTWTGIYNATMERSPCIQTYNNQTVDSEDCLFINVFTPKLNQSLPVMVYIYGGGYTSGAPQVSYLGPDFFLNESVLYVTINYRLGIFGFITTGDLVAPGNGGLKDQAFGLKWVKRNIALFGGDPNKITIFGTSAGGMSVSLLMQSKLTEGLFRSAIMQSGTSLCSWSLSNTTVSLTLDIAKELNMNLSTSNSVIEGLKLIDANTLQTVGYKVWQEYFRRNALNDRSIAPVVEPKHKGAFLTTPPYENLRKGKFHRVPSIIGFNSNEGASMSLTLEYMETLKKYDENHDLLVPLNMNIRSEFQRRILGNIIKYRYFGNGSISEQTTEAEKIFGDSVFVRPIRQTVVMQSVFAPVYYYEFSFRGVWGQFVTGRKNYTGVAHMEEVAYMFYSSLIKSEPKDCLTTRARLIKMWTNFAKFGTPTLDEDAVLQNITWPKANKRILKYLDIGSDLRVKSNPHEEMMSFWNILYTVFAKPSTTY